MMTMRVVPIPAIGTSLEEEMIRAVTIKRVQLLERLKENRATHEEKYLEAFGGYKSKLVAALRKRSDAITVALGMKADEVSDAMSKKIRAAEELRPGESISHSFGVDLGIAVDIAVSLDVPEDHRIDYDRALDRMEWETSDEIQVTEGDFNCFVRDEWGWQARFQGSHRHYTG